MDIFEKHESQVRAYCRSFPAVFDKARDARLWSADGRAYIDFFAGAGALNYGHNPPAIKRKLLDYLAGDGVVHGLDMATTAKARLLERFHEVILAPRGMTHKLLFPGPTGTNAVESAIKMARLVTGRETIVSFTNAFHGMTLGSLALTGNAMKRDGAGVPLPYAVRMPFAGYMGEEMDTLGYLERCLEDDGSGIDLPAAVIVETIQGEGGLNAASFPWLRRLASICRRHKVLLIVDDIQAGCGRTGRFFGFEEAGIVPDIVTLSKSLSGYGIPFAITLFKRELDAWKPGEHNGTFRGNNHAFVTATAAIEAFWQDDRFASQVRAKGEILRRRLAAIAGRYEADAIDTRGRGMMRGIDVKTGEMAERITSRCFEDGLIIETSGPEDEVVKCLCPLVISEADLNRGLDILESAVAEALADRLRAPALTAAE